jgi:hypothetical protein
MKVRAALPLLAISLALTSCMLLKKKGPPADPTQPVTLEIENNNWQDVVIYALVDGTRTRLGSVGAANRTKLEIPLGAMRLPGNMTLLLDPLGSRATYRAGPMSVSFGNLVRLKVENELRLTSWTVQ